MTPTDDNEASEVSHRFVMPEIPECPPEMKEKLEKSEREMAEIFKGSNRKHYKLNEHGEPVTCGWAESVWWIEQAARLGAKRVAATTLPNGWWISTVFLWIDHQWGMGPPILWESMVFDSYSEEDGCGNSLYADRCGGSREQAHAMHDAMVAKAKRVAAGEEKFYDHDDE